MWCCLSGSLLAACDLLRASSAARQPTCVKPPCLRLSFSHSYAQTRDVAADRLPPPCASQKSQSCAFVQYTYRANAEFAKEAMSNQVLVTTEQMESRRGRGDVGRVVDGLRLAPLSTLTTTSSFFSTICSHVLSCLFCVVLRDSWTRGRFCRKGKAQHGRRIRYISTMAVVLGTAAVG